MSIKIVKVEEATPQQWDRVTNHCEYATFFHTREWSEIWRTYQSGKLRNATKYITFNDGTEVLYPMMVRDISFGLIKQYLSAPEWKYGGWLSLSHLSEAHHNALYAYATSMNILLRQNPFDQSFPTNSIPWNLTDYTQVIDLRPGFESIKDYWFREHRSAIRNADRARKAGVTFEEGTTLEDWREYYKVYEAAVDRWGDNIQGEKFDWRLYDSILKSGTKNVKVWIVKLDGKIIGGAVRFYHNKHVVSWNKSVLRDYAKSYASNLLDYELIKQSCDGGYWWYDLDTSGGIEGVIAYKASLGTISLSANMLFHDTSMKRLAKTSRTALLSMSHKLSKTFHKPEVLTPSIDAGYSGKVEEQDRLEVTR